MNPAVRLSVALALGGGLALAGCSQNSAPSPEAIAQQQAEAANADAQRNLETYRQLLRIPNDEMSVSLGKEILRRFPDSEAAKEVQQSLPDIEKRYTENRDKNRLAAMWAYQVAPMAGGTQSTATMYSAGSDPVRLVLRRHTSWGQNVFLYGSKGGFVCKGSGCNLSATVDGKPTQIKVFAPPSGEPALMIRDDNAFIALLKKSSRITMDVTFVNGDKKKTLVYEVGGFDAAKWAPVGKAGKK